MSSFFSVSLGKAALSRKMKAYLHSHAVWQHETVFDAHRYCTSHTYITEHNDLLRLFSPGGFQLRLTSLYQLFSKVKLEYLLWYNWFHPYLEMYYKINGLSHCARSLTIFLIPVILQCLLVPVWTKFKIGQTNGFTFDSTWLILSIYLYNKSQTITSVLLSPIN